MTDIDWTDKDALGTALYLLDRAFANDPLMQLFDRAARERLAKYVVDQLVEWGPKNLYQAGHATKHEILPRSIYSVFGEPLAGEVAYLVQKHLYPESWKETQPND